ncbi:hypothetical protein BYT27DRAFT_7216766 [Phlegmacium glaucopus]|nr:hypothetical protein BYT27DRAFT_7216766 [Phlegmacium glaucopus]
MLTRCKRMSNYCTVLILIYLNYVLINTRWSVLLAARTRILIPTSFNTHYQLIICSINSNFAAAPKPAWVQIPLLEIPVQGKLLERPQVLGLRVFDNVLRCKKCGMILAIKASMATHMLKNYKGSQLEKHMELVYAQTLSEVPGWMTMFEVSKLPTSLISEKQIEADNDDLDRSATLALLRQKKVTVLEGIEVVPNMEVRTVPLVFMRMGIDQFLSPFNRLARQETFMPDRTDPEYLELRSVLLPSFIKNIQYLPWDKVVQNWFSDFWPIQNQNQNQMAGGEPEPELNQNCGSVQLVLVLWTGSEPNFGIPSLDENSSNSSFHLYHYHQLHPLSTKATPAICCTYNASGYSLIWSSSG